MPIRPPAARISRNLARRRGFSFTEILFAVMILGIGFIMVVAIFPVALQQTENSQAETVGTAVARAGVSFVSQNSTMTFVDQSNVVNASQLINFPVLRPTFGGADDWNLYQAAINGTGPVASSLPPLAPASSAPELVGEVWSFDNPAGVDIAAYVNSQLLGATQPLPNVLWPLMAQNMIHSADPRYAWVAFYRRNLVQTSVTPLRYTYATSAQLIVIAVKAQAKQFYDQSDLTLSTTGYPTSIQPSLGRAAINAPGSNNLNYTIQFIDPVLQTRAAEGAFVIISTDLLPLGSVGAGFLNGHVYKLGTVVSGTTDTWEFAPGYGPPIPPVGAPAPSDAVFIGPGRTFRVYMVGKAIDPNDNTSPPKTYAGQAQDIAAYSTFISCPSN